MLLFGLPSQEKLCGWISNHRHVASHKLYPALATGYNLGIWMRFDQCLMKKQFPWHEVTKVQHYWLDVEAVTQSLDLAEHTT